jgi:hypothetical protein
VRWKKVVLGVLALLFVLAGAFAAAPFVLKPPALAPNVIRDSVTRVRRS